MHPTRAPEEGEKGGRAGEPKEVGFGICEKLGSLQLCKCCIGDTTPMAKQIGLGATLFLMSTKALAMFFFVLFLLNVPVLMFYAGGVDHSKSNDKRLMDYFAIFSLGNVGTPGYTCGE